MNLEVLMQKGKRGRKPGSKKLKRASEEVEIMQKINNLKDELKEDPEAVKNLLREKKLQMQIRVSDKRSKEDLQRALRRSKILQSLIDSGKIKPNRIYNAVIWEAPQLHMRQIYLRK